MNTQDEIWLFLSKAITESENKEISFYYDKTNNIVFGLIQKEEQYYPYTRNEVLGISSLKSENFNELIKKINANEGSLYKLPKLLNEEKEILIRSFLEKNLGHSVKVDLENEIPLFVQNDFSKFKSKLKEIDRKVAFKFDMESGIYVSKRVQEIYFPMGVNEKTKVLW